MLTDNFGRTLTYLRISVTDRCNLRCIYCACTNRNDFPAGKNCDEILTFEEIIQVCEVVKKYFSIKNLRLTGGEPLLRKNIEHLIENLSRKGFRVTMTTNGTLITDETARILKKSGLAGINISMDTLVPRIYRKKTGGEIEKVLRGIDAVCSAGFFLENVKINTVITAEDANNTDEILKFIQWCGTKGLTIKFIEEMPLGKDSSISENATGAATYFKDFEKSISDKLKLIKESDKNTIGQGPARYYQTPDGKIHIGFISALSHPFCDICNRLRLSADGHLLPCLGHPEYVDIKKILRTTLDNKTKEKLIAEAFLKAAELKPKNHDGFKRAGCINMNSIGG